MMLFYFNCERAPSAKCFCDQWRPHAVFTVITSPGHNPIHCKSRKKQALSLWYISICCTPACASFPFHKCDRIHPCEAPVLLLKHDNHLTDADISRWPLLIRSKGYSHLQPNKTTNEQQISRNVATTVEQRCRDS